VVVEDEEDNPETVARVVLRMRKLLPHNLPDLIQEAYLAILEGRNIWTACTTYSNAEKKHAHEKLPDTFDHHQLESEKTENETDQYPPHLKSYYELFRDGYTCEEVAARAGIPIDRAYRLRRTVALHRGADARVSDV
jgi:hypothetical protein